MRWMLAFVPLYSAGCAPGDPAEGGPPFPLEAELPGPTEPGTPADTDDDVALARALIEGLRSPEQAFVQIAWSKGFPVYDPATDTYLFVHWYPGGSWALSGDFNGWGQRAMRRRGDLWWVEIPVQGAAGSRYKFVDRGATWIADPWARSFTYDGFGEISYVRPPALEPRLDRWPNVAGEGLGPRDLRVYVPPGSGPWPVLYMHDGNNLFDPDALWGGWRMLDALAAEEPVLVVGIDNTWARIDEYTHAADDIGYGPMGGLGDDYAALVHELVRPRMEQVYGSTGHDGVLGSSLGGLVSLHVAHRYPGAYDFAGSMSGTLGWGRYGDLGPSMEHLYLADGRRPTALYLDSGGSPGADGRCRDLDGDGIPEDDPDDSDNYCVTRHFADAMAAQGYQWNADLFHWYEPGADHDELAWADRVHVPLGLFLSLD